MKYILFALVVILLVLFFTPRQSASYVAPEETLKENIKAYAERRVLEEFGANQWVYFSEVVRRESHWNEVAQNPTSTAFGLCQFLNSTWKSTSYLKTIDPYLQVEACIEYMDSRYGTPQKAKLFHDRKNWF